MMADRTVYAKHVVTRLKEQAAPVKPAAAPKPPAFEDDDGPAADDRTAHHRTTHDGPDHEHRARGRLRAGLLHR